MKVLSAATAIGGVLFAGLVYAQQAPPAPAAAPAPPQAAPAPAPKFIEGSRYAYISIPQVAAESNEGQTLSQRMEALRAKKAGELAEKNKSVESNQAKLRSSVMSEDARAQVQRDIDKAQVEIQRLTQDAQAELQELQNELQLDFQRKLGPVIQAVAKEKGLHFLMSAAESGLVWADPGLDLTQEVIVRFNAAYPRAAAAAAPAAPRK